MNRGPSIQLEQIPEFIEMLKGYTRDIPKVKSSPRWQGLGTFADFIEEE